MVRFTCMQVAAFLRAQSDQLDKAQLGELLGHHEDFAIAVMHGWIDSEPSMAGQAIDQSLRRLLGGFRLPGEAQKIDRIMEKFAEVRFLYFFGSAFCRRCGSCVGGCWLGSGCLGRRRRLATSWKSSQRCALGPCLCYVCPRDRGFYELVCELVCNWWLPGEVQLITA